MQLSTVQALDATTQNVPQGEVKQEERKYTVIYERNEGTEPGIGAIYARKIYDATLGHELTAYGEQGGVGFGAIQRRVYDAVHS